MVFFKPKKANDPLLRSLDGVGRISKILEGKVQSYRVEFAATEWYGKASDSGYSFKLGERVRVIGLVNATTALIQPLTSS
jgi:hypothetical protein